LTSPVAAGVLIAAILTTFAAPFLALMFYSIPAMDDFRIAALEFDGVPQSGTIALAWTYYIHSSPRWLSTLIEGAVMSKVNLFGAYGWLLLAVRWYYRGFSMVFRSQLFGRITKAVSSHNRSVLDGVDGQHDISRRSAVLAQRRGNVLFAS
jgi:hypothetical protein